MKILERLNPTNTGSYNRPIAHALGLGAAVVYSALISKYEYYFKHNMLDEEGFFYSTIADLQESTDIVNIPLHIFLKKFEMFCIGINPHGA